MPIKNETVERRIPQRWDEADMKRVLLSNRRPVTGKIPKDIVTCDLTAYGSQQTLNAKMIIKRVFVT